MASKAQFKLPVSNDLAGSTGWLLTLIPLLLLLAGCAVDPSRNELIDYRDRAQSQVQGGVSVSAVVLSPQETAHSFAMPLTDKNVQPVWLEIDNREEKEFFLMLLSIDPEYFSPSEVAWMFRKQDDDSLEDKIKILASRHIPVIIPAKSTVSGYVYTNLDPGAKAFAVELFTEKDLRSFEFVQLVPGFEADFMRVEFEKNLSAKRSPGS